MATRPLSPEEADEKRDFERLFGEAGWHRMEKTWEQRAKKIRDQALDTISNENNLWYQRGIVAVLEELMRLQTETLASYEEPTTFEPGDVSGY